MRCFSPREPLPGKGSQPLADFSFISGKLNRLQLAGSRNSAEKIARPILVGEFTQLGEVTRCASWASSAG
jgi:hypothetical protein